MNKDRQTAYFAAGCIIILFTMILLGAWNVDVGCADTPETRPTVGVTEPMTTLPPETVATEPPTEATEPSEPPMLMAPKPVPPYTEIDVPAQYLEHKDFKSYEDWRNIKSKNTPHYKLQNAYAYTGEDGIRMVEGRYCIAVGSYFTTRIGQYIDVVLQNGTVIKCILGDQKADAHTDDLHISHNSDGSIVEFIIDKKEMSSLVLTMGSVSYLYEEWQSPVVKILVYDYNFLDKN
jgi:hypothetical protein